MAKWPPNSNIETHLKKKVFYKKCIVQTFMFKMQNIFCEKNIASAQKNAVLICLWWKNGVQNESISSSLLAGFPCKYIKTLFFFNYIHLE